MTKCDVERAGSPTGRGRARARRAGRRGVALMLVMIALGVAGAVTAFYLSSRDNSAALASNARDTTRAGWSARSGAAVAAAILETTLDWRGAAGAEGALVRDMPIGGANVSIVVTDLNGDPPTAETIDVVVSATAEVNGVRSTMQRVENVSPANVAPESAVQPFLGEFTLYATDQLELHDSFVGVWPASPASRAGVPAKVGLGFTGACSLVVSDEVRTNSGAVFARADAQATLKNWTRIAGWAEGGEMPIVPVAVNETVPGEMSALPTAFPSAPTVSGPTTVVTLAQGRYGHVRVTNSGRAILGGPTGGRYSVNNLRIDSSGTVRVRGQVDLEVRGSFTVESLGTVELEDDTSSLRVYAGGNVTLVNGALGAPEAIGRDADRAPEWVAYRSPARVRVMGVGTVARNYSIGTNGLAVADFHAPLSNFKMEGGSVLGRVTAARIKIGLGAVVMGDPSMDNRSGFTTLNGPLYNSDGTPIAGLAAALASFTGSAQALTAHIAANVPAPGPGPAADDGVSTPRRKGAARGRDWPILAIGLERRAAGATDKLAGAFTKPRKLTAMLNDAVWNDPRLTGVTPEGDDDYDGDGVADNQGQINTKSGDTGLVTGILSGLLGA